MWSAPAIFSNRLVHWAFCGVNFDRVPLRCLLQRITRPLRSLELALICVGWCIMTDGCLSIYGDVLCIAPQPT